ncbi:hypothetical protein [Aestuariirhabdus litorea]|uniref:DUF3106 domain-containing protein n=1 Tax=Aestuariirhabdus litorea TaxID=2528527 RepID=A0A3P3VUD5_9GAMM|nr:hypothetical protein [Aestuariirhabdus litorea]RRJ85059.1 hypothetical protein D0544_08275 [Aestuariirhabdus litorea]RWW98284.1 hypothetical protein DZC74_08270 [Endozoicomonadaceae bacterium GTF-13]
MKRIFLLCLTSLLLAACSSQQTDSSSTMAAEPATTPQTEAPVEMAPKAEPAPMPAPEPMNQMSDLEKLWERYCNHESLTTMERQEIADSEMPDRFKGSCTQK